MSRVVLVTGAARPIGARFARQLADDPTVDRVIGVDVAVPPHGLGAAEFLRADIRNPVLAKVVAGESVDTVVHLGALGSPSGAGGRSAMKEINVIGAMQLLAACQRAPSVRRLVVKSSTTVYGSSPADPVVFREDTEPRAVPRSGFAKDAVEIEDYVRGFSRRRPDVSVTVLRFANTLGRGVDSPLARYFALPACPTVLGHDARLQFVHPDDVVAVLHKATVADVPGTVNVAGDGVLLLSQAVRRAGRPTVAVPSFAVSGIGQLARQVGLADFTPEQLAFLTYGRVVDTTQLRDALGVRLVYGTAAAFDDFLVGCPRGLVDAGRLAAAQKRVAAFLGTGGRHE